MAHVVFRSQMAIMICVPNTWTETDMQRYARLQVSDPEQWDMHITIPKEQCMLAVTGKSNPVHRRLLRHTPR